MFFQLGKNLVTTGSRVGQRAFSSSTRLLSGNSEILSGATQPLVLSGISKPLRPTPFDTTPPPQRIPQVTTRREETPPEWVERMAKWESLSSREKPITQEVSKKVHSAALMAHDVYGTDDSGQSQKTLEKMGITPLRKEDYPPELLKDLQEHGLKVAENGRIEDFDTTPPHYIGFDGEPRLMTGEPTRFDPDNHVGLKARAYMDLQGNISLSFAGSSMSPFDGRGPKNWGGTNIPNALGRVTGHELRALALATSLQEHSGGKLKTITGHSLAGCTTKFLTGMIPGVEGVTFNAAPINAGHEKLMRDKGVVPTSIDCTNVVSSNDVVTRLNKGSEIGQRIVGGIYGLTETSGTPGPIFSTGDNTGHGMGELVDSIARKLNPDALKVEAPKTEGPKTEGPEFDEAEESVVLHAHEQSEQNEQTHNVGQRFDIPPVYLDDQRRKRVQEPEEEPELEIVDNILNRDLDGDLEMDSQAKKGIETPHTPTVRELMGRVKEAHSSPKEQQGKSVKEIMQYDPEVSKEAIKQATKHKRGME